MCTENGHKVFATGEPARVKLMWLKSRFRVCNLIMIWCRVLALTYIHRRKTDVELLPVLFIILIVIQVRQSFRHRCYQWRPSRQRICIPNASAASLNPNFPEVDPSQLPKPNSPPPTLPTAPTSSSLVEVRLPMIDCWEVFIVLEFTKLKVKTLSRFMSLQPLTSIR